VRWTQRFVGFLVGASLTQGACWAEGLPHLQRNGEATQLIVDGVPYLALAGELHNSSPSSPAYMAPIWDRLARDGVRTVIGAASWELIEPQEARYDFTAVDDQIKQAHARNIRLVLIWFGAYKNAEATYAPSWVRRDERRFPRTQRDPAAKPKGIAAFLRAGPILSVFSDTLAQADARAFAALMRHIKQVDRNQTIIMIQVENEVGLLGDSRDRSPLANAAWDQQVPTDLMNYLREHRASRRKGRRGRICTADVRQCLAWSAARLVAAWRLSERRPGCSNDGRLEGRGAVTRIARARYLHRRFQQRLNRLSQAEQPNLHSGGALRRGQSVYRTWSA
jgi:beta-galactosidase GanA